MGEGRLGRFVSGLGLGYLHTLVVLAVGLWLTPFLLRQLGTHDYGLWLLASQVLVYLALMDLGVVALVPREVAFAVGERGSVGRGFSPAELSVPPLNPAYSRAWSSFHTPHLRKIASRRPSRIAARRIPSI